MKWGIVQTLGVLVVLDQTGHQGGAELRMLAARIVERKGRDVELALDHRVPLLGGLEQRRGGIDPDVQADVGCRHFARDHLHHLVAHVPLAARPLMRGFELGLG
jgi:hypothetical protein